MITNPISSVSELSGGAPSPAGLVLVDFFWFRSDYRIWFGYQSTSTVTKACLRAPRGVSERLTYSSTVCRSEIVENQGFWMTNRLQSTKKTACRPRSLSRSLVKRLKEPPSSAELVLLNPSNYRGFMASDFTNSDEHTLSKWTRNLSQSTGSVAWAKIFCLGVRL